MRKLAFVIVLFAVCLVAREGAGLPAFANLNPGSNCYPDNLYSCTDGPAFTSSSSGRATFTRGEIQFANQNSYHTAYGGSISWRLVERMSRDSGSFGDTQQGTIGGFLLVDIRWANHTRTTFVSRCMAEVQTISGYEGNVPFREIELEAEGRVNGFPDLRSGTSNAVASIVVKRNEDTGNVERLQLGLELGSTCFEGNTDEAETEFGIDNDDVTVNPNSKFSSQDEDAGAMGFPDGYYEGNCPGFDSTD